MKAGLTRQLPDPACSVRQVWAVAQAAGAPSGAVARLEYQRFWGSHDTGWSFQIDGTEHKLEVADPGCERRKDAFSPILQPRHEPR